MSRLRFLAEAQEELRAAAMFYEAEQPGLGFALIREVRRVLAIIADKPLAARVERNEIRIRSLARFPYRIYYRASTDDVLIVAVGHRRRRPGYWRTRD